MLKDPKKIQTSIFQKFWKIQSPLVIVDSFVCRDLSTIKNNPLLQVLKFDNNDWLFKDNLSNISFVFFIYSEKLYLRNYNLYTEYLSFIEWFESQTYYECLALVYVWMKQCPKYLCEAQISPKLPMWRSKKSSTIKNLRKT